MDFPRANKQTSSNYYNQIKNELNDYFIRTVPIAREYIARIKQNKKYTFTTGKEINEESFKELKTTFILGLESLISNCTDIRIQTELKKLVKVAESEWNSNNTLNNIYDVRKEMDRTYEKNVLK